MPSKWEELFFSFTACVSLRGEWSLGLLITTDKAVSAEVNLQRSYICGHSNIT